MPFLLFYHFILMILLKKLYIFEDLYEVIAIVFQANNSNICTIIFNNCTFLQYLISELQDQIFCMVFGNWKKSHIIKTLFSAFFFKGKFDLPKLTIQQIIQLHFYQLIWTRVFIYIQGQRFYVEIKKKEKRINVLKLVDMQLQQYILRHQQTWGRLYCQSFLQRYVVKHFFHLSIKLTKILFYFIHSFFVTLVTSPLIQSVSVLT